MARGADRWRLQPLSRHFGGDRGTPIDRFFIERFLADHADDIHGRVLEFGDNIYTLKHGGRRVTQSDVLYPFPGKPGVTIVDDLAVGNKIPRAAFNCIVCTQTLQNLFDLGGALRILYRSLKPGGVLLVTLPSIAQLDSGGAKQGWGDYWRPTRFGTARLFADVFGEANVALAAYGNALLATGFLTGLAVHELPAEAFEYRDESYDVSITVRAVKGRAGRRLRSPPIVAPPPAAGHFVVRQGEPSEPAAYATDSVTIGREIVWADGPVNRVRGKLLADEWGFITGIEAYIDARAGDAVRLATHTAGPYYIPACRLEAVAKSGQAEAEACWGGLLETVCLHEGMVESLARQRGESGLELRHRNALRYGVPTVTGQWLSSSIGLRPCLDALRPAYTRLMARKRRAGGKKRDGVGIACMGFGIGAPFTDTTSQASVRLDGRRLRVESAIADPLTRRLLSKIVATTLKIPAAFIAATETSPEAGDTLFAAGRAAVGAAKSLESQLRQRAEAPVSAALGWDDEGPYFDLDHGKLRPSLADGDAVCGLASFTPATMGPDAGGLGSPYPVYGFAAALVAITLDTDSGRVSIKEMAVAADVGRAVAAAAQRRRIREQCAPVAARMLPDLPFRMPAVACHLIEDAEPRAGLGAKWTGEQAAIAVAPALANALHDAIGAPLDQLPASASSITAALRVGRR